MRLMANARLAALGVVLLLPLSAVACGPATDTPATEAATSLGPVVETSAGTLQGAYVDEAEDVLVFRGVRFAKPPVGELRWRPPQAPES